MLRRLSVVVLAASLLALAVSLSHARDEGQWKYAAPDVQEYFSTLKQPDNPFISCCGDTDAYFTDESDSDPDGELVAIITDTRPDEWTRPDGTTGQRPHIDVGTRIRVPAIKIRKHAIPVPLDHGLIFLSTAGSVYCYEPLGGM